MKKILFLLLAFLSLSAHSQSLPCASDAVLQKQIAQDPGLKDRLDLLDLKISEARKQQRTTALPAPGSITIPVVVYVIHDGTTATNISDAQVMAQIDVLNAKFYSTGIKFCMATRANTGSTVPMVNPTTEVQTQPGIIHINNPTLMNHYTTAPQQELLNTAHPSVSGSRYLRIWVVNTIDGPTPGILGYASFPGGYFQGIVIRNSVFGNGTSNLLQYYTEGETLVHEVGHYLGLYHTFERGCGTNGDQTLEGDRVPDTPQVAEPNYQCVPFTNSCTNNPDLDLIHNYMDYGSNVCADSFTTNQKERMVSMASNSRSELISNENLIYAGVCNFQNMIAAKITPSAFTVCASPTTATTFAAPTGVNYSWSWNFGDSFATGANPNTSILQNPSHIFTSAANSPYTVSLTVTNNSTGESAVTSVKIYVTNCVPIQNAGSRWYLSRSNLLNFSSGIPVFDTTMVDTNVTQSNCSVLNNAAGNLLFYTDGISIWKNNHTAINSVPPTGCPQNVENGNLIIENPAVANQYYVFRADQYCFNTLGGGLRYSTVNISGTNATIGLENQPVTETATFNMNGAMGFDLSPYDGALFGCTALVAVKKCDGYWIITNLKRGSQTYIVVFSLTASGLKYKSEIQAGFNSSGILKMSPNGNKLFYGTIYSTDLKYLFDFNKNEGIVNTPVQITPDNSIQTNYTYGVSFSPDSKLLYTSELLKGVFQYNLNAIDINASKKFVGSIPGGYHCNMQLGPDNKIYLAPDHVDELAVIHNPNALITDTNSCNFSKNGPKRNSQNYFQMIDTELPNMIDARAETVNFPTNNVNIISAYVVGCNKYKFFPNYYNSNCGMVYKWYITNTSVAGSPTVVLTETNPVYQFTTTGIYSIIYKNSLNVQIGMTVLSITNFTAPAIVGSATACPGSVNTNRTNNSVALAAGQTVVWSVSSGGTINGSTTDTSVNVQWTTLPGTITATVTNAAGCSAASTKTISAFCPCDCLNTTSLTMTPQLDDAFKFTVLNSNPNQICGGNNFRYTWTKPNGSVYVTTVNHFTSDGMIITVKIEALDANGNPICNVLRSYNTGGGTSNGRILFPSAFNESVKITPNPSKGIFNIRIEKFSGKVNIEVHDMNGKLVFEERNADFNIEKVIDLSKFNSGTYVLKIVGENLNYSQKLIKQ